MESKIFELMQLQNQEKELHMVLTCNEKTESFGLSLSHEDAKELIVSRNTSLKKYQRVEFGEGILPKLIFQFCDSQYINQSEYQKILARLQDIFFRFKNESGDLLTDDELLNYMSEQFEEVCYGDLDYLEGTCLERFAAAIRAGFKGYQNSEGRKVYDQISNEKRWDKDLYLQVLKELFW